jgi:hypothetical protein
LSSEKQTAPFLLADITECRHIADRTALRYSPIGMSATIKVKWLTEGCCSFSREATMLEVKIRPDKYGEALAMLLQLGGGFQTRFERTLIVNSKQQRILQEAGFIAAKDAGNKPRKSRGEKTK